MASTNRLDHTVINVRDNMDAAAALFAALGFTLTPQGRHSTGSINHLMMFGTDYLELLGLPADGNHQRPDIAAAPVGINGIVFKTDDADATYAHAQACGMAGDPPKAFSRPVELDGETRDAKFRTVTMRAGVFPGGRVYFCEHGTPELIWRPEWQRHANRVVCMPEFVVASRAPEAEAADFAKLLGGAATGGAVAFAGGKLSVLSEAGYEARYGALASDLGGRKSIFGALVFACDDLAPLRDILAAPPAGVSAQQASESIVVRARDFDAVLEFVAS